MLTLEVPSIHCEGCAESTENALKKLGGVQNVKVNLTGKLVEVTFRDGVTVEQDIQNAIIRAGDTIGGHGHD